MNGHGVCVCRTDEHGTFRHNPRCPSHVIEHDPRCEVCDQPIAIDTEGASYDPDGRFIHPFGTNCHATAWYEHPLPLSAKNQRTAQTTGLMVARLRPGRSFSVMLWIRNLTPAETGPSDEIMFRCVDLGHVDRLDVALRTEAEVFTSIAGDVEEGRWLPLISAPERLIEWSNLVPLDASRALLGQFLTIVRDQVASRKVGAS